MLDTFKESIRALRALEWPVDHWDDWFVKLMISKLDYTTRNDWQKSREDTNEFPTYQQLTTFLQNKARTQDASRPSSQSFQPANKSQGGNIQKSTKSSISAHTTSAGPKRPVHGCAQCPNETHFTFTCPKFL